MNEDDDPPEDLTGPYAADAPHHDLWQRARERVEDLFRVVDDLPHLARTGVTRAFGRRFCQFVFSIEASIRRLVLVLALQLMPTLGETKPRKPSRSPQRPAPAPATTEGPKRTRVRFRFFALRGAGRRRASTEPKAATATRGPVFSFARDPLLAVGPAPPPRKGQRTSRANWRTRENPQARAYRDLIHGRARPVDDANDLSGGFFTRPVPRPARPRNPPVLRQDRPVAVLKGLPHDHLIPAPALACRIAAMWNVILDPMAFAARAARRLARLAGGIETLRSAPNPKPPSIKGDKREAPALNLLWRCQAVFTGLDDTS